MQRWRRAAASPTVLSTPDSLEGTGVLAPARRTLDAGMSQLRAATRICRVGAAPAERDSAVRVLAEIARFEDGRLSHDLREARELLDGRLSRPPGVSRDRAR